MARATLSEKESFFLGLLADVAIAAVVGTVFWLTNMPVWLGVPLFVLLDGLITRRLTADDR